MRTNSFIQVVCAGIIAGAQALVIEKTNLDTQEMCAAGNEFAQEHIEGLWKLGEGSLAAHYEQTHSNSYYLKLLERAFLKENMDKHKDRTSLDGDLTCYQLDHKKKLIQKLFQECRGPFYEA